MAKKKNILRSGESDAPVDINENLIDALNRIASYSVASYVDNDLSFTKVTDFVSTGDDILDLKISNRRNGGFPFGRITEIYGWQSSGKSLLASYALLNTIKRGGRAVLVDTEYAADPSFLKAIGADISQVLHITPNTLNMAYRLIEEIMTKHYATSPDKPLTIVLDSLNGAVVEEEADATDNKKKGYGTGRAVLTDMFLRRNMSFIARNKICFIIINQIREDPSVVFGDNTRTSGGNALRFFSSVRLYLKRGQEYSIQHSSKAKEIIGHAITVEVTKNKLGPSKRKTDIGMYYAYGMDNESSWEQAMDDYSIWQESGAWKIYTYVDTNTGEEITKRFYKKDFKDMLKTDEVFKNAVFNSICDKVILDLSKYDKDGTKIESENEGELEIDLE